MWICPPRRTMSSLENIEERAAAWLARRDGGDWSASDQLALEAWLNESTSHRVAYLRLERIWDEAARLKVLAAGRGRAGAADGSARPQGPYFGNRSLEHATPAGGRLVRARHFGLATALLALLMGMIWLLPELHFGGHFKTPVGGTASVPLADGSNITLNTATEVRVNLTAQEREVDLPRGEAFFVVAKDPTRPFVVVAGSKRVIAVGTQFSVRHDGDSVEVVVTEGVVRLEPVRGGSAPLESSRLPAGAIARATGGDVLVQHASLPEVEAALSWRQGYLTFHETTLGEAVEEFNRYTERKLRIADPAVAQIRISGTFKPTNSEAFVRLLREGFSINSIATNDSITLTQN